MIAKYFSAMLKEEQIGNMKIEDFSKQLDHFKFCK